MGQTGAEAGQQCPAKDESEAKPKVHATLRQSNDRERPFRLPRELIGTKSTGRVTIKGKVFSCLLDTGSQVTTVTKSYYDQYLSEEQIESLHDLLEVEGPMVCLCLTWVMLRSESPSTLALVVSDTQTSSKSQILIGTNTLDVVYEIYTEANPDGHQPVPYGYRTVLKVLELRQKQCSDGNIGLVRMHGKDKETIPAGKTVVLEGSVSVKEFHTERYAILEYPSASSLPGGLLVKTCLLNLPSSQPCKLPVIISNESEHDITIPARSVIAELSAIQTVTSCRQRCDVQTHPNP